MKFTMTVPVENNDYMLTVRLAVGAVCETNGFDIDSAEDYKVCVNESILILQRSGFNGVVLSFEVNDGLTVLVEGKEKKGAPTDEIENEISYALLGALVDRVDVQKKDGIAEAITLYKSL